MLKQYINNALLYVILFVSLMINAYMLYEVNTIYDRFYYAEVIFDNSKAGFMTKIKCEE